MIFVNFKTYEQGTGKNALGLISILDQVAQSTQKKIIPVVQAADIKEAHESSKLEIWTQKIDPVEYGAHTGSIIAEAVFEDGAAGTFLNHSENKLSIEQIKKGVERAHQAGLKTLVFAADTAELESVLRVQPTFVSLEPPELVGSKTTSVAKEKPEVIAQAVVLSRQKGIPLIVGAGIKSSEDVKKSIELGATGVAVASDIVASSDPKQAIEELILGFEQV